MKLVIAITGASGSLYAQRLVNCLHTALDHESEVHIVLSSHAKRVAEQEIDLFHFPSLFQVHEDTTMEVPFVSGSAKFDAMVVIPCSMGTLGRIAYGFSNSTITRTADVFLKEKRPLILVPRETPWNLIQARNIVTLMEAGATILPANPSFYGKPQTVVDVVDTVIARVLDHLKIPHDLVTRWKTDPSPEP